MPLDLSAVADVLPGLMTQQVDIHELVPPHRGDRGGPESNWSAIPVATGVPCLILPRVPRDHEVATQRQETRYHTVLFNTRVTLNPTRRIVYHDPIEGDRYLYPTGTRNVAECDVAWFADAEEFPAP